MNSDQLISNPEEIPAKRRKLSEEGIFLCCLAF